MINLVITVGYNRELERAIRYIQRGLLMIDQNQDRRLMTISRGKEAPLTRSPRWVSAVLSN